MSSNTPIGAITARVRRAADLRRTASTLALLAGSLGLAALSSPALAQCVEGPPNTYTCAGQTVVSQTLVGDDMSAATTAGFAVDTTANGNGLALSMTGDGQISYTDLQASTLTGAGVRFNSTGSSGLDAGSLVIFSDGAIVADGAHGLRLDNAGGGDATAVWSGSILNTGGNGVFVRTGVGSGDLGLTVADVQGRDDGVRIDFDGAGSLAFIAQGPLTGLTGSGLRIAGDTAGDDYDIQLGEVTGGAWGVVIDNQGTGSTRLVATGTVTGQSEAGIMITGGLDTTDIDVFANAVNGGTYGITVGNFGVGATNIIAAGTVAGTTSFGIIGFNDINATNLSISAADVFGNLGIIADNTGTGATVVVSTGHVVGFTVDAIRVSNGVNATDLLVDVNDVTGMVTGIDVVNFGDGFTAVRASGTVIGENGNGIDIETGAASDGVDVQVAEVHSQSVGIFIDNQGTGGSFLTSTGAISSLLTDGVRIVNGLSTTGLLISVASVQGGVQDTSVGIAARNDGLGSTFISATGPVSGGDQGILAEGGSFATDMTIEVRDVTGGLTGIDVVNFGSGYTSVRSTGAVIGGSSDGISVETGTGSEGVLIEAFDVQAEGNGIVLDNLGTGGSQVWATGDVSAQFGSGIEVNNGAGTTEIEIVAAAVSGGDRGISASSEGTGGVYVTATGPVSGDDFGILAHIGGAGSNVRVEAVDVVSESVGILAENDGDGFTRVISTGTVVGTGEYGIRAFGGTNSFNITIDANNASGGLSGVSAVSFGLGPVEITTFGLVEGGDQGIEAFSAANSVSIVNEGTVRNVFGLPTYRAITASANGVSITNNGLLIGAVDVTASASLLRNDGVWNTAGGTSSFAGGDDAAFNQQGAVIYAADAFDMAETTTWSGLELFVNRGRLQMLDGGAGDTLDTSADAVFDETAELTVDIGGAGVSDVFRTTGAVEIEPGSVLTINTTEPLVLNSQYVVVEAAGGLTGQFDFEDEMLTAFAGLRDGYTANTAFLEFVQLKALAEAGITPNQKETAAGADSLPDGDAVKDALLMLPDEAAAIDAFDQLSGEIHPSARTAAVEDSRLPRNAVLDRLADGERDGAVWGRVHRDDGLSDGDFNAAKVERDTRGAVVGVDRAFGPVTLGVAAGWSDTELDIARRDSDGSVESVHGLVYAGARLGGWGVRVGVGYAQTSTATERRIVFPGVSATPTADYDGSVSQAFAETGYRFALAGGGHAEPFANLTLVRVETDAFTEVAGPALSGEAISEDATISTLGLRFETSHMGPFFLRGSTGWRHASGDLDPAGRHAFDGGATFTVLGAAQSNDAAFANVEAQWRLSPHVTLGIAYDGVLGTDGEDHAITGGFKVVF